MKKKNTYGLSFDIVEQRRKLGLTQGELAKKARVTQSALSCWERGFWAPTKVEQIKRLEKVLTDKRRLRRVNG